LDVNNLFIPFTSRNRPKCNHSIYNYMRLIVAYN
jgi:hypothetical protein